ncbi:MAG: Pvc16 family protein [Cyanobacteria bacterium P01_C01_bin.118]
MSNHLAIATVTATLQRLLQSAIQRDVDGARVTTLKPNSIGSSTPELGINMFLYQVTHNSALRNSDTAAFRSKKGPVRRQSSLDLYYMLSAYGNDTELEPQRLLGSVVRTLSDKTVLTTDMIDAAIEDSVFLAESDLPQHSQRLTINPVDMDTDELSKIWSTFFQAPYSLSMVYKVMAVVIDGELSVHHALPVRESYSRIFPFAHQPVVEKVRAQAGVRSPIEAGTSLRVIGKQLEASGTSVKVGNVEITPQSITDSEILLSLSEVPSLQAGIQALQVLHYPSQQPSAPPVMSNAYPFVLCPTVTLVNVVELEGMDDDPRYGKIQVSTRLSIGKDQRVVIALNEWSVESPATYLFEAHPRQMDTDCLTIPINNVKPGEYLIRLQVDGADSQLGIDTDTDSPTFNWFNRPRVVIE